MIVLFTDTDCDVTPKLAFELGYKLICMPYVINDKTIYPYIDYEEFDYKAFYDMLRGGTIPKTYAISPGEYIKHFEPVFANGDDILYVHFSKATSGTFDSMNIALEELKEKYPERNLYTIDTKSISIGSLNIVYEVANLYKEGKDIEEIIRLANDLVDRSALYFYADDLKFFAKSGRVSNFSAIMGGLIGIHPILHVSNEGKLESLSKARGKIGTLKKIIDYVLELGDDIKNHRILIAHSDALETVNLIVNMLAEKFGELDIIYSVVNPTIGSHCGPGNVGVCFYAKHR